MSHMVTTATASQVRSSPVGVDKGSLRLAAIDVGSNSIHMIIAQADADGAITTLWRMKEMVGLGRMSFPVQIAFQRSNGCRHRHVGAVSSRLPQQRQCEKIIAVATSAVREATTAATSSNARIAKCDCTSASFRRKEEARLIYLAVRHAIQLSDQTASDHRHRRWKRRIHRRR